MMSTNHPPMSWPPWLRAQSVEGHWRFQDVRWPFWKRCFQRVGLGWSEVVSPFWTGGLWLTKLFVKLLGENGGCEWICEYSVYEYIIYITDLLRNSGMIILRVELNMLKTTIQLISIDMASNSAEWLDISPLLFLTTYPLQKGKKTYIPYKMLFRSLTFLST